MFQSLEQSLAIATLITQANGRDPKPDGWFAMLDETNVPDGTMSVRITHSDAHGRSHSFSSTSKPAPNGPPSCGPFGYLLAETCLICHTVRMPTCLVDEKSEGSQWPG
jgi:hypothetical protein